MKQLKRNSLMQRGTGIFPCEACGRKTRETGAQSLSSRTCPECYEIAGIENSLSDGHYEGDAGRDALIAEIAALQTVIIAKGGKPEPSDYLLPASPAASERKALESATPVPPAPTDPCSVCGGFVCFKACERAITAMTDEQLKPYAAEYFKRLGAIRTPPPKVERPCKYCGKLFGARELRQHNKPKCKQEQKAGIEAAEEAKRFQKAVKKFFIGGLDLMGQHRTVADLVFGMRHELDLHAEGETNDLKTARDLNRAKAYVAEFGGAA